MENTVIHRADTRGSTKTEWLEAHPTFSFGSYYNPQRMQFGALRVLNDDIIAGEKGFGDHPHDNMEIITIPLEGALAHRDSLGNGTTIRAGEIQVMSAGTGLYHSEFNAEQDKPVKSLQIWLYPNRRNVEPRYGQAKIDTSERNVLHQVLSPNADGQGVWIYQDAWFHIGKFDKGAEATYQLKAEDNGVYVFVISGEVTVSGQTLGPRDGMGTTNTRQLSIKADSDMEVLLMEVPMTY